MVRPLEQALPSLFPFSLSPPPPLFAPATQAIFFYVQVTFTKNNLQQNENYNLKLTKKKPNTSERLKLEAPEIAKKSA